MLPVSGEETQVDVTWLRQQAGGLETATHCQGYAHNNKNAILPEVIQLADSNQQRIPPLNQLTGIKSLYKCPRKVARSSQGKKARIEAERKKEP